MAGIEKEERPKRFGRAAEKLHGGNIIMAKVTLSKVKKIYPNTERQSKKKKEEPAPDEHLFPGEEARPNLQITEDGVVAVQEFSMEIEDGEFIVLVGPSGCGKSTTLRMIAGLEEISEGEIYIGSRLVNELPPKDRDVSMVFQNYALYPHMTVYENMAFSLNLKKLDKETIDKKVREAAEILHISEYLGRKPKALSGGQRQRVAIGRSIVREPKVFLMDEPLSNLDAKLRNQMRAEIIKLRQRIKATFIYVTHDQTEAMTLGDRIVIMKDGFIQQIGTPQEVWSKPANLFVASFIGSPQMNLVDAELLMEDNDAKMIFLGKTVSLGSEKFEELKAACAGSSSVVLGIRPEHLTLADESDELSFETEIEVSELMGSFVHLHSSILGRDFVQQIPISKLDERHISGIKPGDKISFGFSPERIHIFDKESKKRIG